MTKAKKNHLNTIKEMDKEFLKTKKLMNMEYPRYGWIKSIRKRLGMTTTQLANRLKVSQPRITAIEKDEANLKLETIEKIADALGCEFTYALVPKTNFEDFCFEQAEKKVMQILKQVGHEIPRKKQLTKEDKTELRQLSKEFIENYKSRLWGDS
jgi:predicted DNA-binding mobile mystery protein A